MYVYVCSACVCSACMYVVRVCVYVVHVCVYVVRVYVLYVTSGSMYVVCWHVLCDRGYGSMYVVRVCVCCVLCYVCRGSASTEKEGIKFIYKKYTSYLGSRIDSKYDPSE